MRLDRFIVACGLAETPDAMTDEGRAVLVKNAAGFLAAGGVLTLDDWERMSEESRAAFVVAKKVIEDADREHLAGVPASPVPTAGEALDRQQ